MSISQEELKRLSVNALYDFMAPKYRDVADALKENEIDGEGILKLSEEEVIEIFPKVGIRQKFKKFMAQEGLAMYKVPKASEPPPPYSYVPPNPKMANLPKQASVSGQKSKVIAVKLKSMSKCISEGPPEVYKLPTMVPKENTEMCIASYQVGGENVEDLMCSHKVLMLVGATGSGKSTLINALANHFLNVEFEDAFRFRLISPEDEGGKEQTHSQTSWVNAYKFMHTDDSSRRYRLTIIDTPGYGDTRGVEQDHTITTQIKEFFNSKDLGVDHINGIAFVVKASDVRLTAIQKYIFQSILNIFGSDIGNCIMIAATHADDSKDIPAVAALTEAKVPINDELIFAVNNSSLYAQNSSHKQKEWKKINKYQTTWEENAEMYDKVCNALVRMNDKSLWLTKENLEARETLRIILANIEKRVRENVAMAVEIKKAEALVREQKEEKEKHKDCVYTVPVEHTLQVPHDFQFEESFNCQLCKSSCHSPCIATFQKLKRFCKVINTFKGTCRICGCRSKDHELENFYYETVVVQEKRVKEEFLDYLKAGVGVAVGEAYLARLKEDEQRVMQGNLKLIRQAKLCLRKIQKISLGGIPNITETAYIDTMIESEKEAMQEGWQSRVESLQELKKEAAAMCHIDDLNMDKLDRALDITHMLSFDMEDL